jgi:hypothetical protein
MFSTINILIKKKNQCKTWLRKTVFGSKYINVPANNISSWCTSSRGTIVIRGADIEQCNVSAALSRNPQTSSFKNRRTEFRTNLNLKKIFRHVAPCSLLAITWLPVLTWRWRQYFSLNVSKLLHSVTFRKILYLILLNVFTVSLNIYMQVVCTVYITFDKSMSTVATIIIFMTSHHTSCLSNLKAYW